MVLFEPTGLHPRKRTLHQRWKTKGVPTRTLEAPHDYVGWFEFEELPIRV